MDSDKNRRLFGAAQAGDQRSLAKLLSLTESIGVSLFETLPELLSTVKPVYRIGITGPPGAGKSTLIAALIKDFRSKNLNVGVIAVDPSSPFSKGAILGDRIRYSDHFLDQNVFIRSLGTRGSLGGLSASAYLMLRVFDHMPFDVVLVETVGVGQTELEIVNVADQVAVVLVPESGDSIQAMKAGITEIADIFVVNKSDRPGADSLVRELEAAHEKIVMKTSAHQGVGVPELADKLLGRRPLHLNQIRSTAARLQKEAHALLRGEWEASMQNKISCITNVESFGQFLKSKG